MATIFTEVPKGFVLLGGDEAVKVVEMEKRVIHLRGKYGGVGQVRVIQVRLQEPQP